MTISTPEQIRQASHYRAIQARLWGEKKKTKPVIDKVIKALPRPPSDFSYHMELYRWYQDLISTSLHAGFKVQETTEYQPYEQEITFDFKNAVKSMEQIAMDVLWDFPGVKLKDIRGPRRTKIFIRPRQLAMYQIKMQRPDLSYPAIGRWFGGRDHTTVLHAVRKIEAEEASA